MYSDSFSRARYECHRVRFLRAELGAPFPFHLLLLEGPSFRARRINDRKSTVGGGTERSRLIANRDKEELVADL